MCRAYAEESETINFLTCVERSRTEVRPTERSYQGTRENKLAIIAGLAGIAGDLRLGLGTIYLVHQYSESTIIPRISRHGCEERSTEATWSQL